MIALDDTTVRELNALAQAHYRDTGHVSGVAAVGLGEGVESRDGRRRRGDHAAARPSVGVGAPGVEDGVQSIVGAGTPAGIAVVLEVGVDGGGVADAELEAGVGFPLVR